MLFRFFVHLMVFASTRMAITQVFRRYVNAVSRSSADLLQFTRVGRKRYYFFAQAGRRME